MILHVGLVKTTFRLIVALLATMITVMCAATPLHHHGRHQACLRYAYPNGKVPKSEVKFDLAFDRVNADGESFSCGPSIAAFQARRALESFRYGVLYYDQARFDEAVRYPLKVRIQKTLNSKPKIIFVHNFGEWSTLQKSYMGKRQTEGIACAWLGNVTVKSGYHSPGFFLMYGLVWFQRKGDGATVSVTSIILAPITAEMLKESCFPRNSGDQE